MFICTEFMSINIYFQTCRLPVCLMCTTSKDLVELNATQLLYLLLSARCAVLQAFASFLTVDTTGLCQRTAMSLPAQSPESAHTWKNTHLRDGTHISGVKHCQTTCGVEDQIEFLWYQTMLGGRSATVDVEDKITIDVTRPHHENTIHNHN